MGVYFHGPTGLHTDLYQLTMAYGYWHSGLYRRRACFHLHYRRPPFGGTHVVAAGLDAVIEFIRNFRFSVDDIQYLAGLKGSRGWPLFDESFLNYLQRMVFSCTIEAAPEGTIVLPQEPILRLEGPIIQAQLLETGLLNLINFSSLIATKAARVAQAAEGDPVLEFGYRRAQGPDGALSASRAAFIGGCDATSNVLAGRLFGIPVRGTHAHSWVMCFDDERTAFLEYAKTQPDNCIFLVDTYDTVEGVANAIEAGRWLRASGHEMTGIRLDSGDLGELSIIARRMLDEAGFPDAVIVGSSDLDEYRMRKLKGQGAQIRIWGVGTRLATAYEQPALGGVYKLSAITDEDGQWRPRLKRSDDPAKVSTPGRPAVHRFYDDQGRPYGDMIYDVDIGPGSGQIISYRDGAQVDLQEKTGEPLLKPIFRDGELVYSQPSIRQMRQYCLEQMSLWKDVKDYPCGLETELHRRKTELMEAIEKK